MSDRWDFYLCRVDDQLASIFVNFDIAKNAPLEVFPFMAFVRLYMAKPEAHGLSSDEEFETLEAIEDHLEQALTGHDDAVYVGRNTSDGCRDFYYYAAKSSEWEDRVQAAMKFFPAYHVDAGVREDSSWSTYFEFLYPSDAELQQIKDRHTCEALKKAGDLLTKQREIDHWAYFGDYVSRAAFGDEAITMGFQIRGTSEPDGDSDRYGIQLFRVDAPKNIDEVTRPLFELVKSHGGDYDGWETSVENEM